MTRQRIIAATLALLLAGGSISESLAQGGCVSGSEGRDLVAQGQIMPFPEAIQRAGLSSDQVVDVELCHSGGGYIYRVRVLQDGEVSSVNIPAG